MRIPTREPRRGRFDICADILQSLDSRIVCDKAILAKMSNLDSRAISQYLEVLLRFQLAVRTRNRQGEYRISQKGKTYLNVYARLVEILQ